MGTVSSSLLEKSLAVMKPQREHMVVFPKVEVIDGVVNTWVTDAQAEFVGSPSVKDILPYSCRQEL